MLPALRFASQICSPKGLYNNNIGLCHGAFELKSKVAAGNVEEEEERNFWPQLFFLRVHE